jgi:tRNA (guanine37-N1)-methyltransferase
MMHLAVITILPEMLNSLNYGVCGRAIEQGLARVDVLNPRDWSTRPNRHVDDKPYGGGPGMVMMVEPLHAAIMHAKAQIAKPCRVVYLSPQGKQMKQSDLNAIATVQQPLIFLAGRYEGIDERVIEHDVDEEWSLGDFVISGGELAAMVYIDAIVRLLPGTLGNPGSAVSDSFMTGLLDYPHYTRPECINGSMIPDVLKSGNHHEIARWRRQQALGRTWLRRPELMGALTLNEVDKQLLAEFIDEQGA